MEPSGGLTARSLSEPGGSKKSSMSSDMAVHKFLLEPSLPVVPAHIVRQVLLGRNVAKLTEGQP